MLHVRNVNGKLSALNRCGARLLCCMPPAVALHNVGQACRHDEVHNLVEQGGQVLVRCQTEGDNDRFHQALTQPLRPSGTPCAALGNIGFERRQAPRKPS